MNRIPSIVKTPTNQVSRKVGFMLMCHENSNTVPIANETEDGETTPQPIAKPLPEPSKETDGDLPEVIPDVPNAPIL